MKDLNWISLRQHLSHSLNQVANPHYKIKVTVKVGPPKAQVSQVNRDKQSVTSFPNQTNSAVVPSIRKFSGLSTGSFTANLNAPQTDL